MCYFDLNSLKKLSHGVKDLKKSFLVNAPEVVFGKLMNLFTCMDFNQFHLFSEMY